MSREIPAGALHLLPVETREPEYYRLFILSSLALAGLAGLVLGVHIPVGRLLHWSSEARRPDIIQVHGQVQLLGFAGLFVMGMSLRMMPRFANTHLRFEGLIAPVWGLIVASLATRAFVMVWLPDGPHSILAIWTQFCLLLAGAGYLLVVFGTLLIDTRPLEGTAWFFLAGSTFFLLQAALGTLIAIDEAADDTRVVSYVPNMAVLYLQIGFLLSFIAGVATRALPTMSGIPRPEAGAKRVAALLSASVLLVALPLVWLEYQGYSSGVARLSDLGLVGLGLSLIAIVALSGVMRPARDRTRPASQPHMRLVRLSFAWLLFGSVEAVYFGSRALVEGGLPSFYNLDAFRHTLALGGVTALIMGMALMIVPEFAGERRGANRQAAMSTALLVALGAATILRVGPALLANSLGPDVRNTSMAVAGVLAEFALLYFAASFVRLLMAARRDALPLRPSGMQTS